MYPAESAASPTPISLGDAGGPGRRSPGVGERALQSGDPSDAAGPHVR